MNPKKLPVLICGAGPCGLTVSYLLNQFGIENRVVEKHPGTSHHPKARGVNVRTMELLHNWGLDHKVREHEISKDHRRILWMTGITGDIVGDIRMKEEIFTHSPTTPCAVPQNFLEDAFVDALQDAQYSKVNFSTKLVSFEQQKNTVICQLQNKVTGAAETIECDYLIAADGAHSQIRQALNIAMQGVESLGTYLTIFAKVDLSRWLADKKGVVYTFMGEGQRGRFLMAVDHKEKWIFGIRVIETDVKITNEYCQQVIKSFIDNADIPIDIISHSTWDMAALNCETYSKQCVMLVGDAAHRMPPTGGMGMNTGIHDAHNLAWKLAYVLHGYADASLLDSYEAERKPIVDYTIKWSQHNATRMFEMIQALQNNNEKLFQEKMKDQEKHLNHAGLDLGMIYRSSAIFPDEAINIENIDAEHYTPSSATGMRAPHCEIKMNDKTMSILSLYQKDYVLLCSQSADIKPEQLPIPASYPLKIYRHEKDFTDPNHDYVQKYNADKFQAILVRPDGHIAWRSH